MTFETKINDRIKAARKEGEAYGEAIGEARGRTEGRAEGRVEGRVEGRIESLISLVRKELISVETAASESGLSVEAFMEKMNPASAYEDQAEYSVKQP